MFNLRDATDGDIVACSLRNMTVISKVSFSNPVHRRLVWPLACYEIVPKWMQHVKIGSGNGLVPSGSKPLPGQCWPRFMLPYSNKTSCLLCKQAHKFNSWLISFHKILTFYLLDFIWAIYTSYCRHLLDHTDYRCITKHTDLSCTLNPTFSFNMSVFIFIFSLFLCVFVFTSRWEQMWKSWVL